MLSGAGGQPPRPEAHGAGLGAARPMLAWQLLGMPVLRGDAQDRGPLGTRGLVAGQALLLTSAC